MAFTETRIIRGRDTRCRMSTTTKADFFRNLRKHLTSERTTELEALSLVVKVCPSHYRTSRADVLLISGDKQSVTVTHHRSEKSAQVMFEKLLRWLEDFKVKFADEYAELHALITEMESFTKEVTPGTFELRTKQGSLIGTFTENVMPIMGELQTRFDNGLQYFMTKRDVLYTYVNAYLTALSVDGEPHISKIEQRKPTPKNKFFKKVREYLKDEGVTNLDQISIIKSVEYNYHTKYKASVSLKFIGMLNFSEHKSELTTLVQVTKLTRWLEEFKRVMADEYAAVDERIKEMEANTAQPSPSVFTLCTPSGSVISEFTQDDSSQWFRLGEKNYSTKAKVYSRLIEKYEEALKVDEATA